MLAIVAFHWWIRVLGYRYSYVCGAFKSIREVYIHLRQRPVPQQEARKASQIGPSKLRPQ